MKIFVLLPRVPYPLHKGDKLRAYNQIKELAKNNELFILAITHSKIKQKSLEKLKEISPNIIIKKANFIEVYLRMFWTLVFSNKPIQTAYFFNSKIKKELNKSINSFKPDIIYTQLLRTAEYIKELKNATKVLDFQDAFSMGMKRRAEKAI